MHIRPPRKASDWDQLFSLYENAFSPEEREPTPDLRDLYKAGSRQIDLLMSADKLIGFSVVDHYPDQEYSLLSYVALSPEFRNQGLGSILCLDVIYNFQLLSDPIAMFVEAKDRPAKLYASLGFHYANVPYGAPEYGGDGTVKMNLMFLPHEKNKARLTEAFFTRCVKSILKDGYGLSETDPRLISQIQVTKAFRY